MKYRWATQVMTRHSGMLTIFCKDREQAESNVREFIKKYNSGDTQVSFDSSSATANMTLTYEIVSVTVLDILMSYETHKQDMLEHKRLQAEVDFSQENNSYDE